MISHSCEPLLDAAAESASSFPDKDLKLLGHLTCTIVTMDDETPENYREAFQVSLTSFLQFNMSLNKPKGREIYSKYTE